MAGGQSWGEDRDSWRNFEESEWRREGWRASQSRERERERQWGEGEQVESMREMTFSGTRRLRLEQVNRVRAQRGGAEKGALAYGVISSWIPFR